MLQMPKHLKIINYTSTASPTGQPSPITALVAHLFKKKKEEKQKKLLKYEESWEENKKKRRRRNAAR